MDTCHNKTERDFCERKGQSITGDALLQIIIAGIVAGLIVGFLGGQQFAQLVAQTPGTTVTGMFFVVAGIFGSILAILSLPINLLVVAFIGNLILFVVASKLFKGKGTFTQQFYLTTLYYVPLSIVSIIFISVFEISIGRIVGIVIGLYELYLTLLAVKEAHQF